MKKILILNGPNLNLLGKRETEIYGHQSFEEYLQLLQEQFPDLELYYSQSNLEGELINELHKADGAYIGVVFNPGAYAHTSIALRDAIGSIDTSVIEVHISNIFRRESFRHHSYVSEVCIGVVAGFGLRSYELAVSYLLDLEPPEEPIIYLS